MKCEVMIYRTFTNLKASLSNYITDTMLQESKTDTLFITNTDRARLHALVFGFSLFKGDAVTSKNIRISSLSSVDCLRI